MVRLAVVARHLLAGLYRSPRVELHPAPVAPHEGVRLARVVDVAEGAAAARGVERRAVVELHDLDRLSGGARAPPGLALGNEFAAQLAQLPPRGKGREREESTALYATASDFEVERVQARNYIRGSRRRQRHEGINHRDTEARLKQKAVF